MPVCISILQTPACQAWLCGRGGGQLHNLNQRPDLFFVRTTFASSVKQAQLNQQLAIFVITRNGTCDKDVSNLIVLRFVVISIIDSVIQKKITLS